MVEEGEPVIDGRPISEMKVVELKEELGKRGLSKIGNKNALHERLKEFLLSESGAKDEGDKQSAAVESPQRDLTSPPNPLVAEYLAKQQTALREARKDAEAVRRASSGDDTSPVREKSAVAARRLRRGRRESATSENTSAVAEEKSVEPAVTSENEQESVAHDVEKTEDDISRARKVDQKEVIDDKDSAPEAVKAKTPEEAERTDTEADEVKMSKVEQPKEAEVATSAEIVSAKQEVSKEEESKEEEEVSAGTEEAGSGSEEDSSSSRSRSEAAEESNEAFVEQSAADLEESSNQGMAEAADDVSVEKVEVMESTKETRTMEIETKTNITPERKRRWKPSEAIHTGSSVVTVSVTKHTEEKEEEVEIHEQEDRPDTQPSVAADFKEDLSDSKDKMEELDYEEPVQSSVAEVAKEVKVAEESAEKQETKTYEVHGRHAKRLEPPRMRRRSLTPDKHRESQTTVDGFVRERSVSPARYPVNQVIMIRQLTRPYTVKQLQQLLATFGTIVEGGFWIDNIKSTCIAKYATVEEAVVARGRLHNIVWPPCSPKTLKIDYSDDANLDKHLAADQQLSERVTKENAEKKKSPPESSAPALRVSLSVDEKRRHVQSASQDESEKDLVKEEREKRGHEHRERKRSASPLGHSDAKRARERRSPVRDERRRPASPDSKPKEPEKRVKTADELFLKTKTQPAIYYLPLTEEQIVERAKRKAVEAELAKKVAQNGTPAKRREKDEQAKEKTSVSKRASAKSPPSRRRSRTPPSRRRSRSPVAQRDRRHSRSRSPRRRR